MTEPMITITGLSKRYGGLMAVDGLDLTIYKGEIFGLLGPNGAGKSTTILVLLGLTEASGGKVNVCGYDPLLQPIEVKTRVGYLPDDVGFYENRSGMENLLYTARLNRIPKEEALRRAQRLLEEVGLSADGDKKAGAYSRGMRQRLGLADVLIKAPSIIILDEPTLGIDPRGVREFLDLIVRLSKEQGITVLLSSHHLHQVQQVCDRVGLFVGGKLIAEGDVDALSAKLFKSERFVIEAGIAYSNGDPLSMDHAMLLADAMRRMEGVATVTFADGTFSIGCDRDNAPGIARIVVDAGYGLMLLQKKKYGLDEIYHRYFEGGSTYGKTA
jgi:ABC-2 type transport system ATP-binding protein